MAKKPTLSLCIIVKDEADFLRRCLESVKPIVDEIIMVDTGSKDNTIEIAKSFGAKVIKQKWNNNFSEARNISLKHATKDWILVLDADETISKKDLKKIKELLDKAEYDAFSLIQRNYFKERKPTSIEVSSKGDIYKESKPYLGWFPSKLVRLFKNMDCYEFEGIIHELIEPSIKRKHGRIKPTEIPIHHFRVEKDTVFDSQKRQEYLKMGLRQIQLTPDNPKPYYEVGQIYLYDKDYDRAIELFEKGIELIEESKNQLDQKGTYVYISLSLGKAYLEKGRFKDAINFLTKFLNQFPNTLLVYFFLGQAYTMLNRFQEAIQSYQKAAKLSPNDEEIHNNLANTYSRVGMFNDAIREFKIATSLTPDNATIHRNLGATYFGMKKYASAYDSFKKAVELNPEFEKDLRDILKKLEKVKDNTLEIDYSFSIK